MENHLIYIVTYRDKSDTCQYGKEEKVVLAASKKEALEKVKEKNKEWNIDAANYTVSKGKKVVDYLIEKGVIDF